MFIKIKIFNRYYYAQYFKIYLFKIKILGEVGIVLEEFVIAINRIKIE